MVRAASRAGIHCRSGCITNQPEADDAGSVALLDQAQPAESTRPVTTCARRSGGRLDLTPQRPESGSTGAGLPDLPEQA